WFPWLKTELEKNGFQVHVPAMPESAEPKIEAWVSHLSKIVGDVDKNTYFVGHSIGCQTILRYLETLPADKKVGGATFVAGWFTLMNLAGKRVRYSSWGKRVRYSSWVSMVNVWSTQAQIF
ncbi:MAG: alpha/beta hydrolase, partial [Patescibacteria group bacterium]